MNKFTKSVLTRICVGMALLFIPLLLTDIMNDEQAQKGIPEYIAFYSVVVVICAVASAWVKQSLKDRPYTNLFDEALIIPLICTFAAVIHFSLKANSDNPLDFGWVLVVGFYSFHIAIGVFIKNLVLIIWNTGKPKADDGSLNVSEDSSKRDKKETE